MPATKWPDQPDWFRQPCQISLDKPNPTSHCLTFSQYIILACMQTTAQYQTKFMYITGICIIQFITNTEGYRGYRKWRLTILRLIHGLGSVNCVVVIGTVMLAGYRRVWGLHDVKCTFIALGQSTWRRVHLKLQHFELCRMPTPLQRWRCVLVNGQMASSVLG